MERGELERRDRVLRDYFAGRDWDRNPEYQLAREAVVSPPPELADFPLLFDYEWEVFPGHSQHGKADLLFTDGDGRFAVVEVKWLDLEAPSNSNRGKRAKKNRKDVIAQARSYALDVLAHVEDAGFVRAFICTNQHGVRTVGYANFMDSVDLDPWTGQPV